MSQKRQHVRFDFQTEVDLELTGSTEQGTTVNISQGGTLVNTAAVIPFGEKIVLHIKLPGLPDICKMPSIVRWSKQGEGVGLQFESVRAIEVWAINKLKRA